MLARGLILVLGMFCGVCRAFRTGGGAAAAAGASQARRWRTVARAISSERAAADGVSLDAKLMAENPDLVRDHLASRRASEEIMDSVLEVQKLMKSRNELIFQRDGALNQRKTLSAEIGKLMKGGQADEAEELKKKVAALNDEADSADAKVTDMEAKIADLADRVPNLLDDRVPDGADEADNVEVRAWGTDKRKLGEEGEWKWHDELADALEPKAFLPEAAVRLSGARFSVLQGSLARLERALSSFFLDELGADGYVETSVPLLVSRSTLRGTGQLPKFEEDLFKVSHKVNGDEDAFLIPTAEVPLTNLYKEQLVDAKDVPVKLCALTPCFRAEAGSYGRDTRGMLRQHQFLKVEMVRVERPEDSEAAQQEMVASAERLLQKLELPYRVVMLCSGDVGFSARMCYDIEVWLPGQQMYREISSISNCGDFQSKRMGFRYRDLIPAEDPKKKPKKVNVNPHTLNGSGLAVGRTLVALLENHQNEDGSVSVPEVLRPYMGGQETL